MERIEYSRYGGPEVMRLAPFERPSLRSDDILVKVAAAAINPVDWQIRAGKMRLLTGSAFPRAMGKDFAGTVAAIGGGISGWKVGDAVLGCVPWKRAGAFAPFALVGVRDIVAKPEALSFSQAAALPTVGLTAWHGLVDQAKLKAGQSLLVNGAAGGVGSAVIQIARTLGAKITARVGSRSFDRMRTFELDDILDYRAPVPATLNHKFDVIFDCHGGIASSDLDRLLKPGGVAIDITIKMPKLMRSIVLPRQKLAFGTMDQKALSHVVELAAAGNLQLGIGAEVPIENAIPLITLLESGESIYGKALIVFDRTAP